MVSLITESRFPMAGQQGHRSRNIQFKARTWEDLRMIAAQDEEMTIASKALYEKNQDKYARIWAQAHEDFLAEERMLVNRVKDAESKAKQAESKAEQAESKAEHLRALLIANNIDPDSTL